MSAATVGRDAVAPARPRAAVRPVSFGRLLTSEWIKLRSLRSTWWTLGVTVVLFVAFAVLQTWGSATDPENFGTGVAQAGAGFVTGGWFLAQLVVCVLGVLVISGEYGTGQIRSTLAAEPRRAPVLLAKLVVLFTTVLVTMLAAVGLAWAGASPWFGALGVTVDPSDPSTLRMLLGAPLYLATLAALAFAFGALLRSSAAGIATILGLVLVLENAIFLIRLEIVQAAAMFLPSRAGSLVLQDDANLDASVWMAQSDNLPALGPWQGYAALAGWVVALLALAIVLLRRRDA